MFRVMDYMLRSASAFDQDLGWCVDGDVDLRRLRVLQQDIPVAVIARGRGRRVDVGAF